MPKNRQKEDDRSRVPAPPKWIVRMVMFELCVFFFSHMIGSFFPHLPMHLNVFLYHFLSLDISTRLLFTRSNDIAYEIAWILFESVMVHATGIKQSMALLFVLCIARSSLEFQIALCFFFGCHQHHQNVFGDLLHIALDISRNSGSCLDDSMVMASIMRLLWK